MVPMSAPAAQVESRPSRGVTPALLTLVALTAAFTVGTLVRASGYGQGRAIDYEVLYAVVFVAWALLPFIVMGAVVIVAARRTRGAMVVVALGVVALVVLTVVLLLSFLASESSTAALLFIFLPIYQLLVVGATAGTTLVVHLALRRRQAHRLPPGHVES